MTILAFEPDNGKESDLDREPTPSFNGYNVDCEDCCFIERASLYLAGSEKDGQAAAMAIRSAENHATSLRHRVTVSLRMVWEEHGLRTETRTDIHRAIPRDEIDEVR